MASSSRNSSNLRCNSVFHRRCKHDIPALMKTSHTDKNPERRYFSCLHRGSWDDCGFWEWIDPELTPYYKSCFLKFKREMDNAQEQLQSVIFERNNCEVDECNQANESEHKKDEELKAMTKEMEVKLKTMEWRIKVMYIAFAFFVFIVVVMKLG